MAMRYGLATGSYIRPAITSTIRPNMPCTSKTACRCALSAGSASRPAVKLRRSAGGTSFGSKVSLMNRHKLNLIETNKHEETYQPANSGQDSEIQANGGEVVSCARKRCRLLCGNQENGEPNGQDPQLR